MTALLLATVLALQSAPPQFPDSPAGRIASAYFDAFNRDADAAHAFEETQRCAAGLRARSMDERLAQYRELRQRWGELRPQTIETGPDGALTVTARASASGAILRLTFNLESSPPHKLESIAIEGPPDDAPAAPLAPTNRAQVLESLADALSERYVFPDKGARMAEMLRASATSGKYDDCADTAALAQRVTDDLQQMCSDKHLRVRIAAPAAAGPGPGPRINLPHNRPADNFGFVRVEVLDGNIGYVRLDGFSPAAAAREPAAASMAFVARCDALVFDLRHNGGGSPEMIKFLCSYLFEERTHLNSFFDRMGNKTDESWTLAEIPGKRFPMTMPVYVLTSNYTFSGAEEFSYNLQTRKRATIVGETTGGGAHPVSPAEVGHGLVAMIPFARAENPLTKTNWEGVGVRPDIEAPADQALEAALADARKRLGRQ